MEIQFTPLAEEARAQQFVIAAHDDALPAGVGRDHIERLAGGHAQAAALADGEVVDALMFAQCTAIGRERWSRAFAPWGTPLSSM